MADAKLDMDTESTTVKLEQLREALAELESNRSLSLHDTTQWEAIREHFDNLEKSLKVQFAELEEKEKVFKEEQAETQTLLAEKEATVAAKEQAMLDRLQELKYDAVAAIIEARKECKVDFPVPVDMGGSKENKLSTIANGESNAHNRASEKKFSDNRSGKSTVGVSIQDIPRPHVKQLCEEMNERMQFFIEECDHIQAFQFIVDDSGGFTSVAEDMLQSIADEYTTTPVLLYTARDPGGHIHGVGRKGSISRAS